MVFIRMLRGLYKSLSGDGTGWQFALGMALGTFLGLVPWRAPDPETGILGFNLTWFVGLAVVIIIRCSFHAAVVGFLIFGLLGRLFLDSLSFSIGRSLLEGIAPQGLVQSLYNSQLLSGFQLHTYWTAGAVLLGLVLGGVMYVVSLVLVNKYREPIRQRLQQSKLLRALNRLWPVRFLRWVFVGGV